ncbi:MAG: WYL domain-containing protein [Propionicimonas sp.]|nr:WYL domain-containing protein [Propionicimonas sp.]
MTSSDQVSRLLNLVPYLQRHGGEADLAETASVFEVSSAQLVKDLDVLWYCGLPGGLPDDLIDVDSEGLDSGRIRISNAEFLSRPLRFTPDEALSLIVALQAIGELAPPQIGQAVDSAVAKLAGAQGAARPSAFAIAEQTGSTGIRQQLGRAIEDGLAVRLTYDGPTRARTTTPEVEPVRLVTRDGYAYLQAWSLERGDWRIYRLDRIVEVTPTDRPAVDRGEPEPFTTGWLEQRADAVPVTLELTRDAGWITEYYPVREARPTDRGLEIDLLVADPAWLRALLLRLGGAVLRVDPPELTAAAREAATEALGYYAALGAGR